MGSQCSFSRTRVEVWWRGAKRTSLAAKVWILLERLDDRIRCTYEETIEVVKTWEDIGRVTGPWGPFLILGSGGGWRLPRRDTHNVCLAWQCFCLCTLDSVFTLTKRKTLYKVFWTHSTYSTGHLSPVGNTYTKFNTQAEADLSSKHNQVRRALMDWWTNDRHRARHSRQITAF